MIEMIGIWSHALAATLFAALAIWQLRHPGGTAQRSALIGGLAATAFWALAVAVEGPDAVLSLFAESGRNLAWLGFMFILLRRGDEGRSAAASVLYGVIALVILAGVVLDAMAVGLDAGAQVANAIEFSALVLRLMVTIGSLVLVHNLYNAAAPDARWGIRLPMIALGVLWIYDLNLYTVAYLVDGWAVELYALRGIMLMLLVPMFALAARRNDKWKMQLSRTVAFQSLSLVAIGSYLVLMVIVTTALNYVGGDYARAAQISFVFGTTVASLVLLPSDTFRAWFKVKVAKHFFQHRYDYRVEWLRFTDTIGQRDEAAAPLDARVIQAVADITDSPGGLLLLPDDAGTLATHSRWNWATADVPAHAADHATARYFETTGRIVELDVTRRAGGGEEHDAIPAWMLDDPRIWAAVPLVHFDRLAGIVLLARPPIDRTLDWEDFDLLRVVGRQAASYLAEARGQEALSEARRFDEFNRRFAFIMHDIKNLVSQLTLVAHNAERHAHNPEFRLDMIETLKDSAGRMNDLLARLSQHNKARREDPRPIVVGRVIEEVALAKRALHPVTVSGPADLMALADPARLEQIVGHLVQNAIDASPANEPVHVTTVRRGLHVAIEILDRGHGMSGDFMRSQLFKPFASTKNGGFGVGAFEARTLAASMGGRIEVESREGEGSRFTLILPQVDVRERDPNEKAA